MDSGQSEVPLLSEQDVVLARQLVRKKAQEAGLSLVDQTKLVTAASELARNTVIYGGGGKMTLEMLPEGRKGVRLAFKDKGPGIRDVDRALKGGWTSGSGLGMGLSGSKRLVNEFDLVTRVGEGTCVTIAHWR
jgi:serine/threonine-protein kinase RsbT